LVETGVRMEWREQMERPKVDVIIPTYKPDEKLELLMQRLQKQTLQPDHIYIINTIPSKKSDRDRIEPYRHMEHVSVIDILQEEFDHGGTRNQGVQMSQADFIVMMTQDAVPADSHLLEALLAPFCDAKVAAAYARSACY